MSITQRNPDSGEFDYEKLLNSNNLAYKTQADITLSNFDGSGIPQVKAGSIFANNGTQFENDSDATIFDSGVANGWVYVKYSVTNNRFEYTVTSPTWSDAKQGYYNSNDRYFFKMYKVGAGEFRHKLKFKTYYDLSAPYQQFIYLNLTGSTTEDDIFDLFDYLIPNNGDYVDTIGSYEDSTYTREVLTAMRRSSTVVQLAQAIYLKLSPYSGSQPMTTMTSGSAATPANDSGYISINHREI
ncbi:hypothetical protein KAR91_72680 [Candidatus Pacearchaeota archaeon]|nr:hypothetical protein [Candidatus Pacearchaeota archaeon]